MDIVIPWVDGADPAWRKERDRYLSGPAKDSLSDESEARFRDEGTLKYLLRSIERFMPWAGTIHFVTWGHTPEWMKTDAQGLHIVNHRDYIPEKYLPTFSSHTIELNMHRIPDLAERFIYFNDDLLVLRPTAKEDFFKNGLPRDFAVETALIGRYHRSIAGVALGNMEVLNAHFSKRKVQKANLSKWFSPCYGKEQLKTLLLRAWPQFSDLSYYHTANAFLKSTFEEVWNAAGSELDETCSHRFRQMNDINQWIMRDWQLLSGRFIPKSPKGGKNYNLGSELPQIRKAIEERRYQMICINDVNYETIDNYEQTVQTLQEVLETFLPEKSRFEK